MRWLSHPLRWRPENVHLASTAVVSDPDDRQRGIWNGPRARSVGDLDSVRWVLVEGSTGGGAPIDRGALAIAEDAFDAEDLLAGLLDANESVVENGLYAVGVTWTTDADAAAGALLAALQGQGLENVVSVSEIEAAESFGRRYRRHRRV